ncbi:hypothetical protein [Lacticaseibacillus sp. GG6-2]
MKKKLSVWRLAAGLMAVGVLVALVGFALSGFNPEAYGAYANQWYTVVHF